MELWKWPLLSYCCAPETGLLWDWSGCGSDSCDLTPLLSSHMPAYQCWPVTKTLNDHLEPPLVPSIGLATAEVFHDRYSILPKCPNLRGFPSGTLQQISASSTIPTPGNIFLHRTTINFIISSFYNKWLCE